MTSKVKILLVAVLLLTVPSWAEDFPSLEQGKSLFESTELGSKQLSCAGCHPQGKGLDQIGDFNDEELKDIINACIRDAMGGALIGLDSPEMTALHGYVSTFQKN